MFVCLFIYFCSVVCAAMGEGGEFFFGFFILLLIFVAFGAVLLLLIYGVRCCRRKMQRRELERRQNAHDERERQRAVQLLEMLSILREPITFPASVQGRTASLASSTRSPASVSRTMRRGTRMGNSASMHSEGGWLNERKDSNDLVQNVPSEVETAAAETASTQVLRSSTVSFHR
ncbi:hypothetical protein TcYC6_0106130 [Trypanosoma cruzi]|uniref:Uncharacterized protein n=1 Tax=Trypanosoma cruzi (strain CL Brener) TaxID=353153 RepID=Q4CUP3_TRYCC|nr:hypothetical protein Tc00.1047053509433.10 [Trypanosoma cruzi]EAN83994.1 hypothetical protein Tc00.1047053509433.10 [Trypanosoma cruzi]KAF8284611.1 hypothetical protein TcYC6_0026870 [Trypanosoma cruzi]KAF8293731.1 hypothetical protein TcYC6_0106130 [Trypanosoma cruzi]|eukprot:XP_805845.1 hypothetical protein [Trypanosoma cruzi strain CL Brener]